jgi:hypothetical protein
VTGGATGNGSGSVSYSVSANTATASRTATLTIAGRTVTVTQAALTCSYTVNPAAATVVSTASTGSIAVTTSAGCSWTATSLVPWITASGTGSASGIASYTVAANSTATPRTGTVQIGTQTIQVTQSGMGVPSAPSNLRVASKR